MDESHRPVVQNPPTSGAGGRVVEVYYDNDLNNPRRFIVIMVLVAVVTAFAVGVAIASLGGGPGRAGSAGVIGVMAAFAIFALIMFVRTRRANVGKMLAGFPDHELEHHIAATLEKLRAVSAVNSLKELVRVLAQRGVCDVAFRVIRSATPPLGKTIDVPFEPRPLESCGQAGSVSEDGSAGENADLSLDQRIKRNVLLKGGWVLVAVFAFNWIIALVQSVARGQPEPQLYSWSLAMLALLLIPVRPGGSWWGTQQFQVVPGGLARRKAPPWSQKWDVHLFDRRRSVMLVCTLKNKMWGVFVADAERVEYTIGTREEMDFAVRAWLSPVEPPKVEWLGNPN